MTDELLAKIMNQMNVDVPIARISSKNYLFGTRKLQTKVVQDNNLMVRVGGGYCTLIEFIETYQQGELIKIADLQAKGEWDFDALLKYHKAQSAGGPIDNVAVPPSLIKRESSAGRIMSPRRTTLGR